MKNSIILFLALFISQSIFAAPVIECHSDGSMDQILKISIGNSDIAGTVAAQVAYRKGSSDISLILMESEGNMNDSKILLSKEARFSAGTEEVFIEKSSLGWYLVKYHVKPSGKSAIEVDRKMLKCQFADDEVY